MPALRTDFHCSLIPLSRSNGFDAVHGAAYRSGERLENAKGEVFDYSRRALKREIGASFLVAPKAISWPLRAGRQAVWQAADAAENRKNSVPAYDLELALPHELPRKKMVEMLRQLAQEIAEAHGVGIDSTLHLPHQEKPTAPAGAAPGEIGKSGEDDGWKNFHAHLMISSRSLTHDGFGAKVRAFSDNRDLGPATIAHWRKRWAAIENAALREAGIDERVTHLSYEALGLDLEPMQHEGRRARYGSPRAVDGDIAAKNAQIRERNRAKLAAVVIDDNGERVLDDEPAESVEDLERQRNEIDAQIAQLEADEAAARLIAERRKKQPAPKPLAPAPRPRPALPAIAPAHEAVRSMWLEARIQHRLPRYPLATAEDLADLSRYWRDAKLSDGSWEYTNRGGRVVDAGDEISADAGNDIEIRAMIDLAKAKRWRDIQFTGSDDFKRRAMRAALLAGLQVSPKTGEDAETLARVRAELQPAPPPIADPMAALRNAAARFPDPPKPPASDAKPPSPPASETPKLRPPGRR